MSTYTQILCQIVFGSYDYSNFLTAENEKILFPYMAVILKNKSCHSYIVGGANNHIHIITHTHPTIAPAYLIKDIKLASHKMIMQNKKAFPNFKKWQVGYGLFTYHISAKDNLIRYVLNQHEHHKTVTYKQELIDLLKEHSLDFDEDLLIT